MCFKETLLFAMGKDLILMEEETNRFVLQFLKDDFERFFHLQKKKQIFRQNWSLSIMKPTK